MFITALFVIAPKWKQPKHPVTDEWINSLWNIHIIYPVIYKEETIYVTTLMNVKNILSKRSQTQKDVCV